MATWLESVNAKDGNPGEQVLEEAHAVLAIVAAKTTPDEAARSGAGLLSAAQGPPRLRRRAASWVVAFVRSAMGRRPCWTECEKAVTE